MTSIAPLITRFLREHMPQQRGYSPHSCEAYAYSFRLLFVFASGRLHTRPSWLCCKFFGRQEAAFRWTDFRWRLPRIVH